MFKKYIPRQFKLVLVSYLNYRSRSQKFKKENFSELDNSLGNILEEVSTELKSYKYPGTAKYIFYQRFVAEKLVSVDKSFKGELGRGWLSQGHLPHVNEIRDFVDSYRFNMTSQVRSGLHDKINSIEDDLNVYKSIMCLRVND